MIVADGSSELGHLYFDSKCVQFGTTLLFRVSFVDQIYGFVSLGNVFETPAMPVVPWSKVARKIGLQLEFDDCFEYAIIFFSDHFLLSIDV